MSAAGAASAPERVRWAALDTVALTRRNLMRYVREPQLLAVLIVQPVLFVLLFRYVFGGAVGQALPPGVDYVDYLMPGIFVQTVVFNATETGIYLAEDLAKGLVDRFRSLPMTRGAVLVARAVADFARNLLVISLMVGVGYAVGFRFGGDPGEALAAVVLSAAVGIAVTWISAFSALSLRSVQAVNATTFVWILPFTFASSAFVPVDSMPSWLRAFAENQPITAFVDAVRDLSLGQPAGDSVLVALAWLAGILAVFVPLTAWRWRSVT